MFFHDFPIWMGDDQYFYRGVTPRPPASIIEFDHGKNLEFQIVSQKISRAPPSAWWCAHTGTVFKLAIMNHHDHVSSKDLILWELCKKAERSIFPLFVSFCGILCKTFKKQSDLVFGICRRLMVFAIVFWRRFERFCRRELSHKMCTLHTQISISIIQEMVSQRLCQWHFKADWPANIAGQSLAFWSYSLRLRAVVACRSWRAFVRRFFWCPFVFWLFGWLSGWLIWGDNGLLFIWSADDPFCVCLAEGVVAMSADAEGLMAVKKDGACEHWPVQDLEDDDEQLV